jgi:large subunit ribosomal protein L31e
MANKNRNKNEVEREYTIPLREKIRSVPRYKKTPKAIKSIKEFLAKHMKIENRDLTKIKLSTYLNQFMWARGIKNPPTKIKVRATRKGENILVELINYPEKLKFKKTRAERQGKEALETIENKKSMMKKMKESLQKPKEETEEDKEKAKESQEKAKASAESTKELEKAQAKQAKHQTEKPKKAAKPMRVALQK